jgi:tRNA threonylcarbamoyl adenosine modification protein YeaZ
MRVLAFDMTSKRLTVGIAEDSCVLGRWDAPANRDRGNTLDSLIDQALADLHWRRTDIDGLALATGPGSLTATRIGWATASGWSLAGGIPVTGWPTHEIQRRWWQDHDLDGNCVTSNADAKKAAIYCMVHHRGDEFYCYDLKLGHADHFQPAAVRIDEWHPPTGALAWIVGPGVLGYRQRWMEVLGKGIEVVVEEYAIVGGDQLAQWGIGDLNSRRFLPVSESPLDYGLPPQFRKAL